MAYGLANLNRYDLARAIIAVIALYGFVLQGFLGGMMPRPASDGLCAGHAQTEGAPGKPLPHDRGACCTAAQAAGAGLPPRMNPVPVAWPAQADRRTAWTFLDAPHARAPPGRIAPPRGPPAV